MVTMIDAEDVVRASEQDDGAVILDVLAKESYENRHLPGAVNVPVGAPDFEEQVQELVPSKQTPVIVYCGSTSCMASTDASERLERMGYRDVREFKAGLEGWKEAGQEFEGAPMRVRANVESSSESAA